MFDQHIPEQNLYTRGFPGQFGFPEALNDFKEYVNNNAADIRGLSPGFVQRLKKHRHVIGDSTMANDMRDSIVRVLNFVDGVSSDVDQQDVADVRGYFDFYSLH